jgi:hypothetical protein
MNVHVVMQYRIPNNLTQLIGIFISEALAKKRIEELKIEYRKFLDYYEWDIYEKQVIEK